MLLKPVSYFTIRDRAERRRIDRRAARERGDGAVDIGEGRRIGAADIGGQARLIDPLVEHQPPFQIGIAAHQMRAQIRDTIGRRKLEEEWNRWLREMRGEAYVDVRAQAGAASGG